MLMQPLKNNNKVIQRPFENNRVKLLYFFTKLELQHHKHQTSNNDRLTAFDPGQPG